MVSRMHTKLENALYQFKILLSSHKIYYSLPLHSTHNYPTRFSQLSLTTPKSTTAAGHRRVEYQCSSMWNKLPVNIRTVAEELGFRRLLKEHLLASLWYVTGRLPTNWCSAPWLAAVLLRRGPCHLYLWSDWLRKQCKASMLACLPPLLCL